MELDLYIKTKAERWSKSLEFDESTRKEILTLLEHHKNEDLTDRFYRDLEFGTGGLRGILGAGTARINIYNVKKASAAVAQYLQSFFKNEPLKVAVSYDSRKFSKEFAMTTAEVFAAHGIQALITKELRPVPMLSFMIRYFQCHGGVCITASHNPPEYNGYKVYWQNGSQLIPPHDKEIMARYKNINSYTSIPSMDYKDGLKSGLITEIGDELDMPYFREVENLSVRTEERNNFKIVFTPLHGTGAYPVKEALKRFGFNNIIIVPEQEKPDGNFPTVSAPNPENPRALDLAVKLAQKENADLVLGTDPDGDRVGIVVNENNSMIFFNGNELGSLLLEYYLSGVQEKGLLPNNALVIKTIVTTDLQRDIAEYYGAACEETLTGFKWICNLIDDYETGRKKPYKKYICGGEESYGFLAGTFVRDKDGIIACSLAAEMVAYYKSKKLTLTDVLNQLYRRHGLYQESLYNLELPGKTGAEKISKMMNTLRLAPPREIAGIPVKFIRDFSKDQEYTIQNNQIITGAKLSLPASDVLQFILEDKTKISVRPSGTEPKIKFYVSVYMAGVSEKTTDTELNKMKKICCDRVKTIEKSFVSSAT